MMLLILLSVIVTVVVVSAYRWNVTSDEACSAYQADSYTIASFGTTAYDEVTITTIRFSIRNHSTAAVRTVGLGKSAFCDLALDFAMQQACQVMSSLLVGPAPKLPCSRVGKALGTDRNYKVRLTCSWGRPMSSDSQHAVKLRTHRPGGLSSLVLFYKLCHCLSNTS